MTRPRLPPTRLLAACAAGPAGLLAMVALPACSSTTSAAPFDASANRPDVVVVDTGTTAADGTSPVDAAGLHTNVRVALLSQLGFGVDVCVRTGTAPFEGPLLYNDFPSEPDAGGDASVTADAGAVDASGADGDGGPGSDAGDAGTDGEATDAAADVTSDAGVEDASPADASGGPGADATSDAADATAPAVDSGIRAGGIVFENVSNYVSVGLAGTMDVAVVLGGSSTCSHPLFTQRVTLDAGKYSTLVILGAPPITVADGGVLDAGIDATGDASRDGGSSSEAGVGDASVPGMSLVVLTDDPSTSATDARARFFNALSSGDGIPASALQVAALAPGGAVPLATTVPVDGVGLPNASDPSVDALGYWEGAPLVSSPAIDLRVSVLATGDGGVADAGDGGPPSWIFGPNPQQGSFHLVAGSNHTGFLIGPGSSAPSLLWCTEGASSASTQTSCVLVAGQ